MDKNPSPIDEDEMKCVRQCNPSVSADMEIDTEKMKGDAIGDTLYSECWVIKILMKLVQFKDEDWSTDMETDLCLLWDMTMEPDVVALLMQHKFLQLSSHTIRNTEVPRLMEVMVGIIGNMCCVKEVRTEILCSADLVALLLDFLSVTDSLTLIQLMRVLQAIAYDIYKMKVSSEVQTEGGQDSKEKCSDECFFLEHLRTSNKWVEKIAFLLNNSMNNDLLCDALFLLNTLYQIPHRDKLVTNYLACSDIVHGILEALKHLYLELEDDASSLEKAACHGAEILASFTSFPDGKGALGKHMEFASETLYMHLPKDLSPDCMSRNQYLLIISTVTVISNLLEAGYFDPLVFSCFLSYLALLQERKEKEDGDRCQDIVEGLEQYFKLVVQHSDRDTVAAALQDCSVDQVKILQAVMER